MNHHKLQLGQFVPISSCYYCSDSLSEQLAIFVATKPDAVIQLYY